MRLVCKPTVRFKGFTPALLRILSTLDEMVKTAHPGNGVPNPLTITSGADSHTAGGHVRGTAVDVRTKDFGDSVGKHLFARVLRGRLGDDFYVELEFEGGTNEHLHIQLRQGRTYDP